MNADDGTGAGRGTQAAPTTPGPYTGGRPGLSRPVAGRDGSPAFDVVALTGSAGGIAAVLAVLRELPAWFPVPLAVMLHLPPQSTLVDMLRHLPFKAEWAAQGAVLAPGRLLMCPPRSFVELLPDGSCVVSACGRGAVDRPIDRFLDSLARSFGNRALGVVLTGMGEDAAAGARELHRAGGRVLVQSEATAEQPSMPAAAIAAGAADMVLPLAEIGPVIAELAAGTPRSRMRPEVAAIRRTFGDRGEVAARALDIDWSRTPLGPALGWPAELRLMARTALESPYPTAVWWGPQLIQIYNDAWCGFLGATKHPRALGGRARESWAEIWDDVGPMVERVMNRGEAAGGEDYRMLIDRHGYLEEVFTSFSYSPIRDAAGAVLGVLHTAYETTRNVVAERRMRALRTLSAHMGDADTPREACVRAAAALATDPSDVPLALLYLLDDGRRQATLAAAAGVEPGAAAAPHVVALADDNAPWPLSRAVPRIATAAGAAVLLEDLARECPQLALPPAPPAGTAPPHAAFLLPLRVAREEAPMGVLVLALSPHRPLDDACRSFVDLVGAQVCAGLAHARARQRERERSERLAEVDLAKTQFFANVSHEFRTPLTLLLAPLEEALRQREALPAPLAADLDVAARNARRLLTLVTNLLDFSQIESRRQRATLVSVDLGALTADIASHFRSAMEAAGLRLRVDCDPALPPVPVDPEMWTKIVSNLLSNAFKFTFDGEISVTLRALRLHAELVVADSGIGIAPQEQPQVFQRFHRVRGARSRTVEGAGIGLSIVQDLVNRMGGQLTLRSTEGRGSAFTIWMPFKSPRALGEPAAQGAVPPSTGLAADVAEQALRWLPDALAEPAGVLDDLLGPPPQDAGAVAPAAPRSRVLVMDDNADMRDYLRRLLSARWDVEVAADGQSGLAAAQRLHPAVILADLMMPGLDGFEVVRRVRNDALLRHTPIVLVTARADEAAAIEGLMAGADDYIAKPFSPRELVARVRTVVERARADAALRDSEQRYRALFESMDEAYAVVEMLKDDSGAWADFRFLEVNPAFMQHTAMPYPVGKTASQLLGTPNPQWARLYGQVLDSGQPLRVEQTEATLGRVFDLNIFTLERQRHRVAILFTNITQRRAAEAALRESEARSRKLVEGLAQATWETNADGEVVTDSPSWRHYTGQSLRQWLGYGWLDAVHPDDRAHVQRQWREAVAARRNVNTEFRLRHAASGGHRWTNVRAVPLPGDDGAIQKWVGMNIDIHDRKQAEQALREGEAAAAQAERRAEALIERMGDAHCVLDREFRILHVNAATERLLGVPRAALVGHSHWDLFPASVDAPVGRAYRRVVAEGVEQHLTHHYTGEGYDMHIELDAYPTDEGGVALFWRDVTARVRAAQALRESEARMRAIANLVPDLLWRSDALGQVQWYSQRWFDYTGLPESQALGEGWAAIIHPEDLRATQRRWKVATRRRRAYRFEHRLRRHDGEYRWFLSRAEPLLDDGGAVRAWFGSVTDIHEQRCARELLEQRVKARTGELERAGEQRRELLARVETLQDEERRRIARELHDSLGQLLSALLLSVAGVRALPLAAPVAEHFGKLQQLLEATDHELDRIVFTLRPTALEDSGLADAVAAYVGTWSGLCGQPVDLLVSGLREQRLPARVEAAVFRVVQEALNNVARHAQAGSVSVVLERLGGALVGSVEDDGVGFVTERAADADADGSRPGWGLLGMRERIEALGGSFDIESHPGRGTAVLWRVPLH